MNSLPSKRLSPPSWWARRLPLLAGVVALAVGTSVHTAPPDPHAGHHAATPVETASANTPTQRWATDLPLRQGMANIRTAVEALGHGQHGHLNPDQTITLAKQIEGHVSGIIADCKLEPRADAALHVIIARLMQGAAALKADPKKTDVVTGMREAVQAYAKQFDDPDWPAAADAIE